ncbi:hypothetical protein FRACYDRAFT_249587 [Fragilariopsis cylindrus CCMP1102]|uniref:Uncharacterized protein n=1 Tax=Fragilariopsis cylindrus CCMP1102 TaxID=635003 RepID=A0A1E7ES67_9STRA|nr:hypothetical protein FRACYDRAFT_249587 [Fragilariopsis cylindrus CCMP1102]|eukprot:OEU08687.1 hypothetical protein FRACYDRAFT_249587 [Fragilariopsis cylindrus CCMP1102]
MSSFSFQKKQANDSDSNSNSSNKSNNVTFIPLNYVEHQTYNNTKIVDGFAISGGVAGTADATEKKKDALIDNYITENIMKLSLEDRSRVSEEINGVYCMAPEETPEMIQNALQQLEIELGSIPYKKKVAYQRSQSLAAAAAAAASTAAAAHKKSSTEIITETKKKKVVSFVNSDNFRLRFLRAELFDIKDAAQRMVKYLDFVLELFGPYALERAIELRDFNKQEIKWFQLGKGMVTIVLPGGPGNAWLSPLKVNARAGHLATKRHEVTPIRCASFHFCMTDNPVYRIIRDFVVLCDYIPKSRMKFHMGEDTELRYTLQGFGVPVDLIPVTDLIISKTNEYTSMISKRNLYKWLAEEIINKRHGRFLKWNDNGYWTILSDESQIIVKISTSCKAVLNKLKKSINANNNRMTIESSTYAFERQDALINYKRKRCLVDDDTNSSNSNNNNNNNKGQHNGHANYNDGGGGGYDASSSTATTATATGGSRSMSWQPFSGCQDL